MTATLSPLANLQIGVGLPTLGERGMPGTLDAAGAARHVEALGLDFVDAADLTIGDGTPHWRSPWPSAAAAAVTERVDIGFGVLALPLRPVAWVATQVQTLLHISGNRSLLGAASPSAARAIAMTEGCHCDDGMLAERTRLAAADVMLPRLYAAVVQIPQPRVRSTGRSGSPAAIPAWTPTAD